MFGNFLSEFVKKVYKLSGVKTDFNYPISEYPKTTNPNKYFAFVQGLITSKTIIEVSERIVENPFVFMNLGLKKHSKILEVGCCRSTVALELANLGYKVTGVDLKKYKYIHPNLTFKQGDLRYLNLPKNYFDAVTAISTIEHTGMGAYKEKKSKQGDFEMVDIIHNLLKSGGKLIITLPFGKAEVNKHERIYDSKRIKKLLRKFKIIKEEYYKGLGRKYWRPVNKKGLKNISSIKEGFTQGIVCIVALKKLAFT